MSGRVAFVTGASDGVGQSVARQLAEAGAVRPGQSPSSPHATERRAAGFGMR